MSELASELRDYLCEYVSRLEHPVLCPLSGGVDSHSLLFACLETKTPVSAISFMLDGVMSTDYSLARRSARQHNVEFISLILPKDTYTILNDVKSLIRLGCRKKTDIECCFPFKYVAPFSKDFPSVISGYRADVYFGLSKNAAMSGCMKDVNALNAYRAKAFSSPLVQPKVIQKMLDKTGAKYYCPYASDQVRSMFHNRTWVELNKPKQKQPIRSTFQKYFSKTKLKPHSNLQLGDSKISEQFKRLLLDKTINQRSHKSVVGLYNELAKSN